MVSREIRYGVIGTGMMGCEHIANINALSGARVVAVADPYEASIEAGQRLAGLDDQFCFDHHEDLLAGVPIDALVVATPDNAHTQIVLDALEADAHLLIEKPLATTIDECDRMIESARSHRGVVWMGMEYRYKPPIARLLHETLSGTAGKVHMISIREHRHPFLDKVNAWNRFRRNTGGTLVEKCCHFFDLMNVMARSTAIRVYGTGAQDVNHLDESYDGETPDIIDNAYVVVDYENGIRAMLDLCMFAEGSKNEQELSVAGDLGKIEAFVPESTVRIGDRETGKGEEIEVTDERIAYVGLHEGSSYLEHLAFLEAINSGGPPAVTLEDGRLTVAMGLAGHLSIDEGRPVLLEEILG